MVNYLNETFRQKYAKEMFGTLSIIKDEPHKETNFNREETLATLQDLNTMLNNYMTELLCNLKDDKLNDE